MSETRQCPFHKIEIHKYTQECKLCVIQDERDEAESLLASATDLLNSWAREMQVEQAHDEKDIRGVIDRLWSALSSRLFAAPAPASPQVGETQPASICEAHYDCSDCNAYAEAYEKKLRAALAESDKTKNELREELLHTKSALKVAMQNYSDACNEVERARAEALEEAARLMESTNYDRSGAQSALAIRALAAQPTPAPKEKR